MAGLGREKMASRLASKRNCNRTATLIFKTTEVGGIEETTRRSAGINLGRGNQKVEKSH